MLHKSVPVFSGARLNQNLVIVLLKEFNSFDFVAQNKAIEILGEAANKVSEDLQSANSSIPWRAIVGMRNRLVHAYFDVDTEMVWKTLQSEIPELLSTLQALLLSDQA